MTNRRDAGFTVLEVLVALVLMALAAASFYRAVDFGARGTRLAIREAQALTVAENELAAAVKRGIDGPTELSGITEQGIAWTASLSPLPGASSPSGLRTAKIDVTAQWRDVPGQPVRTLTLTSLLATRGSP